MFSVEDLLISHGYQAPRRGSGDKPPPTSSSSSDSFQARCHREGWRKSGHGTVNGYEADRRPAAGGRRPTVEDDLSDSQGSEGRRAGASCCAHGQGLSPLPADDTGLNSGRPLPCSSRVSSGKDVNYWRRRGQDFSVLLDYTNRGDSEGTNTMKTQNIPKLELKDHLLKNKLHKTEASRPDQQKGWIAEGQSMLEREVYEGKWRTPMDRKCQSLGTEEWKSSLGRQLSDSEGNRLRQNMLPKMVSDEVFQKEGIEYVKKGKSQSLPRVIPDTNGKEFQTGLHYITTSGFNRNRLEYQCLKDHLVLQTSSAYCNPKASSKWRENVQQSTQFTQLSKTKFNRPLKPPSYELYQQIRSSEMIPSLHVHEENEGQDIYFAKDNDVGAEHNSCPQLLTNCNLEPPVYVPPPSYKAPPQQKAGQKSFDKVPGCNTSAGQLPQATKTHLDQAHWCSENEGINKAHQSPAFDENHAKQLQLQAKNIRDGLGSNAPHTQKSHSTLHNGYVNDQKAFVKYIPFNDPRIRHITIMQSEKQCEEADYKQEHWNATEQIAEGNKIFGPSHRRSAFSVPSGSHYSTQAGLRLIAGPTTSNKWQVASKLEDENIVKSGPCYTPYVGDQCDSSLRHDSRILPSTIHPADFPQPSANAEVKPHANTGTTETVTQVKKWEPDSQCLAAPGKKQPKRRMTETIFCLISVPLKTSKESSDDAALSSDVRNGHVEKFNLDSTGNLTEQSFLSMSSSDLELQTLTGNMMPENGVKRLEHWNELSNKCADGYNFNQHRELRASGSWPGDQYKDQETQTGFNKGPRATHSFTSALKKIAKDYQSQRQSLSEPENSVLMEGDKISEEDTVISDQKWKQSNHSINGRTSLHPSSNSAFSRTAPAQYQVSKSHKNHLERTSKSPGRDAEEQVEESRACPQTSSNNDQGSIGFGQFLLKPVNRRPWDAISELENFNKEIQEHEDHNMQISQEQSEDREISASQLISSDKGFLNTQMPSCQNSELWLPEKPLTAPKEILDSGISKHCSDYTNILLEPQKPLRTSPVRNQHSSQLSNPLHEPISRRTSRTKSTMILNVSSTKNAQFTKLNNEKNAEDTYNKSQCKSINGVSKPMYQLSERKAQDILDKSTIIKDKAAGKKVVPAPKTGRNGIITKMFSQFDDHQTFSETDLSPLISCKSTKPIDDNLNDLFEHKAVEGISKTESFEERAARILGIDVAVEALISPTKKFQLQGVGENEAKSSSEEELDHTCKHIAPGSKCTSGEVLQDGIGKGLELDKPLEWKDSSVYITWLENGNTTPQNKLPKRDSVINKEMHLGERAVHDIFHEPFKEFYNWADKNCCFGTEIKSTSLMGPERKGRSTSGTIETLQGKLTTSPSRTALERLARMKEVDSVSRIRRLSIKSADSADELDEDQCSTEQGDKERPFMSVQKNDMRPTKKQVISLGQDLETFVPSIAVATENKEAGDTYDPSKVETV
ncbi:junctional cadherin 5-associated protein isoform X2 [Narcine bancroftii]|uniref:junctional cadherin 5-associated protein isoform X2 n=1 Tax=Narcine bancroftii TaxID=1343680 RepID=UPI0038313C4C